VSDYLLDGATLLAAMAAPFRLRSEAHAVLVDRSNRIFVSAATFLDAYELEQDDRAAFPALRGRLQSAATQLGFLALDTTPAHVDRAATLAAALPWPRRILRAQAEMLPATLLTLE
jgi:PIN domain nuclease of toxin-antitoxin system